MLRPSERRALRLDMPSAVSQDDAPPSIACGDAQRSPLLSATNRSFLRVVSHELRTPLNSILGFSEILASELYGPLGSPHYREYAQIIRSSGEKLLKLVNQVVEIARLQIGDVEIDVQPEPLGPIFDALGEGLDEPLASRGLRLEVTPCGDVAVLADGRALRSVLTTLLQTAASLSPDDATLTVDVRAEAGQLDIAVASGGPSPEHARQGESASLGLAVCDLTCRAMGARLELASGPGFAAHVWLPAA